VTAVFVTTISAVADARTVAAVVPSSLIRVVLTVLVTWHDSRVAVALHATSEGLNPFN
jgi:hypothetical protein